MRKNYDFSKGVRGRFHRPRQQLRTPVYLDAAVERRLRAVAGDSADLGKLVSRIVKGQLKLVNLVK